jgi:hypothetical protein
MKIKNLYDSFTGFDNFILYDHLSDEIKTIVKSNSCTSKSGYIDFDDLIKNPYVLKFPSNELVRRVSVTITNYFGYPHYYSSVALENNYILDKEYIWCQISSINLSKIKSDDKILQLLKDFILSSNFEECSDQLNTYRSAEDWAKNIVEENGFNDKTRYRITFNNNTDYDGISFRDGD